MFWPQERQQKRSATAAYMTDLSEHSLFDREDVVEAGDFKNLEDHVVRAAYDHGAGFLDLLLGLEQDAQAGGGDVLQVGEVKDEVGDAFEGCVQDVFEFVNSGGIQAAGYLKGKGLIFFYLIDGHGFVSLKLLVDDHFDFVAADTDADLIGDVGHDGAFELVPLFRGFFFLDGFAVFIEGPHGGVTGVTEVDGVFAGIHEAGGEEVVVRVIQRFDRAFEDLTDLAHNAFGGGIFAGSCVGNEFFAQFGVHDGEGLQVDLEGVFFVFDPEVSVIFVGQASHHAHGFFCQQSQLEGLFYVELF